MEIRVRDPGKGLTVTIRAEPDSSVAFIKREACSALGLDPEEYVLTLGHERLAEQSTLSEGGVGEGDVLTLIRRGVWEALKGGA